MRNFLPSAGFHTDTNSIKQVLHLSCSDQVKDLLTEDMILGIGGGVGYGYFTFYYEKEDFSSFYLGIRASWESSADYINDTFRALGCTPVITQTKDRRAAFDKLYDNVSNQIPTIIAIHQGVFENTSLEQSGYPFYSVVYEIQKEKGTAKLTNRYAEGIEIPIEDLIEGRNNLATSKLKNQAIFLKNNDEAGEITFEKVVLAAKIGIESYIKHANNPRMSNFGISALEKWEGLLTTKGKQSWIKLFGETKHLVGALYYTNYWIVNNTDGFAMRKEYSHFLKKVGNIINEPLLLECSQMFEQSGKLWEKLAEAALTDEVEEFRKMKEIISKCNTATIKGELTHHQYLQKLDEIRELKSNAKQSLSWTDQQKVECFAQLSEFVSEIKSIESKALHYMESALQSKGWKDYSL